MKTVLVIRHVAFEDLGSFAAPLQSHGYRIRYLEAGMDDLAQVDALAPELMVVLGGPIGANDQDDYPFLRDEMEILQQRLGHERPTLGICLGSQLMARALGAQVYPGRQPEIGWAPMQLTQPGQASCLRHLAPESTLVLHWHGDTFDLPTGATRLASTSGCENQAFAWGGCALGLQFHPEVTVAGLGRWFIGHALEIAHTPNISVTQLRADTERWGTTLETQGPRCLAHWLQELQSSLT